MTELETGFADTKVAVRIARLCCDQDLPGFTRETPCYWILLTAAPGLFRLLYTLHYTYYK